MFLTKENIEQIVATYVKEFKNNPFVETSYNLSFDDCYITTKTEEPIHINRVYSMNISSKYKELISLLKSLGFNVE